MDDEIIPLSTIKSNKSSNKDQSNEDVIYGLPEKYVSDLGTIHVRGNKHIVLTFIQMSDDDMKIIKQFAIMFNIHTLNLTSKWDDRITHFIAKTQSDNLCDIRTFKFLHALLSGCFIVSFEWVQQCLNSRTLLPENDFMPFDTTGDPSPLTAWRVRRGIIDSPMEWTKNCILYFHRSSKYHLAYSKFHVWAMKAGFVLANEMTELKNEKYRMRVILVNTAEKDVGYIYNIFFPNQTRIKEWLIEYKAVTIYIDWFMECLFRYKFVFFESKYQVMKLNNASINYLDMDESMFQIDEV